MTVLAAVDLDGTLIYSRRAMGDGDAELALTCVERRDELPASFMTQRAADLLTQLAGLAAVVPVTSRVASQWARVRLPMPPPAYAVTANGGVLLVDGVAEPGWTQAIRAELADGYPIAGIREQLRLVCDAAWTRGLRDADGLFAYAAVEPGRLPVGFLADLRAWAAERGWRVSLQGRKVYVVPDRLTKGAAVAEVARRLGATAVLAAGDAALDADLLLAADRAIRPRHGELFDSGWAGPGVELTASTGARAGEQIVAWLLAQAGSPG